MVVALSEPLGAAAVLAGMAWAATVVVAAAALIAVPVPEEAELLPLKPLADLDLGLGATGDFRLGSHKGHQKGLSPSNAPRIALGSPRINANRPNGLFQVWRRAVHGENAGHAEGAMPVADRIGDLAGLVLMPERVAGAELVRFLGRHDGHDGRLGLGVESLLGHDDSGDSGVRTACPFPWRGSPLVPLRAGQARR